MRVIGSFLLGTNHWAASKGSQRGGREHIQTADLSVHPREVESIPPSDGKEKLTFTVSPCPSSRHCARLSLKTLSGN